MEYIFLIFVIVMLVLQGLGRLVESMKPPASPPAGRTPQRRGAPPQGGPSAGRQPSQAQETPFEALIRMFEPVEEPPPTAPPPQRHRPPPLARRPRAVARPARPVPVARRVQTQEEDHGGDLGGRHLHTSLEARHLATTIGQGTMHGRARIADTVQVSAKEKTIEQKLAHLTPWQRAFVYTELLGPPRSKTGFKRSF